MANQQQIAKKDAFQSRKTFTVQGKTYSYYSLKALEDQGIGNVSKLPYSIKVLLESVLRQVDGRVITKEHVENLAKWGTAEVKDIDVPLNHPALFCRTLPVFQPLLTLLH